MAVFKKNINGKLVYLKSVSVDDAEFTLKLRNSEKAVNVMGKINSSLEHQKEWIISQRLKYKDYFFIISNKDNIKIGIIGFYNINEDEKIFEIGRYVSTGSPLENIEALIIAIDACMNYYNVDKVLIHVLKNNKSVYRFWKKFGAKDEKEIIFRDSPAVEMILYKQDFYIYRNKFYNSFSI